VTGMQSAQGNRVS